MLRDGKFACGTMVLGLALLVSGARAQGPSLKDQIVGTWLFESVYDQFEDGRKVFPFGEKPKGQWIFGSDGRFAEIIVGEPRPELKSNDRRRPDAFIVAWYGTYSVNEAEKVITWRPEGGGYSGNIGHEIKLKVVEVTKDKLSYVGLPRAGHEGKFSPHTELRRPNK